MQNILSPKGMINSEQHVSLKNNTYKHMKEIPFFSVIIPLYNKEKYILKTLETVINQSFNNFEVIIIDDGSTDNSVNLIENIEDNRIKIFHKENQGVSSARNHGMQKAKSDYIAFLDADDLWLDHHLQILFDLIQEFPEAGLFSTGYLISFNSHKKRAVIKGLPDEFKGIITNFFKNNLYSPIVNSSIAAIKKSVLTNVNGFDLNLKSGQDTDFWIRVALENKVAFHNVVTGIYMKNDESLSNSIFVKDRIKFLNKFTHLETINKGLKQYMDMNRYSVAIYYKVLNKNTISKSVYDDISKDNLSLKQRLVYHIPQKILKYLFNTKKRLDKLGFFLNLYR
ncbi:MAG: glycosyltransferase family 2 protein [Winogradskyella sp.]|uniref:glycosyltransferase family 2 protein n=1 Tax=Winogradskyella sp. TaxID=1883156 RepID=UPI0017BC4736|nr:glycosyltransferase family 2 protein [Winogradskyella sp.]MBT8245459.1 glycosyltransferase [Winogradskyella sp.]NNK22306.1 glycosyltransferase family 2 protein [Winogradskyella sp.]